MYENRLLGIGLISFLMLFSIISTSYAELWELVIEVNVEKGAIYSGDSVIVTGKVVDQAYKPIRGAEVFIKAGSYTTKAFTDPEGVFKGEIKDFERIPGTYIVNVIGSWYGMTGLSSTEFQVKGDISPVSELQEKLSTDEAIKYLSSDESDFEKNPIGQTLFKYYHKLLDELILEQKIAQKPSEDKIFMEHQRLIAENLRNQAIDEFKPGSGTYDGIQYNDYINNLNPKIKELVINQLNFTKNNFAEAQKIRDDILANGGTYEDARQAYLDRISIPKETLEEFNKEKIDQELEESLENNTTDENSENQ
ncbi:MAG: carboxypeptidase regulatory-like domain-containing protein [Nitrosopumilus sp.]|uniref:carboxypeptidase regulatory-like domain-containing protein n=1 Tax=Nitrosopumilus sp. TaxID=2024843 RepID=UPI00243003A5|nr:carboxypeptidase regulatory-like domain-containing protein [Nitrosopumilus sp.]MCV0367509.1 carboxypeptidase regulatory-like domain-containing protein [Nitrosopumilus sp.]